jgi:hypothetical protein
MSKRHYLIESISPVSLSQREAGSSVQKLRIREHGKLAKHGNQKTKDIKISAGDV